VAGRPLFVVSACLLGRPVRYDGGHKLDVWIRDELGQAADILAVCPEVEAGLGLPRQPMALRRGPEGPRLLGLNDSRDFTELVRRFCAARAEQLAGQPLAGFILKSRSPSCGLAAPLLGQDGRPDGEITTGLFAQAVRARFPGLILVQETDLAHAQGRAAILSLVALAR
jgi:uncharacterized protein YbbK (DUF523 family)